MGVDTAVRIGSVVLPNPVMTAAGTSGHGAELHDFGALNSLGAVVVKSMSAFPWPGNPAPRLHPISDGMLNAVGLQGPGIMQWASDHLEKLAQHEARVVVSLWGRTADEYEEAAEQVRAILSSLQSAASIVAVEVNLSCPNVAGHGIIAHDPDLSAEIIRRCGRIERPVWAKLSPNTDRLADLARIVHASGAEAVTLVNTVSGLVLDERTGRSVLGHGTGGGLSGRVIHPIAVKAVHDVRVACPDLPIIGVGGVTQAWEAVELMMVGASAVQVGTATFADPRASFRIAADLVTWAAERGHRALRDLTDLYHS
jgi:dihydroorotate dehydrogenase (NAD+) catalytic subunit